MTQKNESGRQAAPGDVAEVPRAATDLEESATVVVRVLPTPRPGDPGVSIPEYALWRRTNDRTIRHAIQTGRLDAAIRRDLNGRWWVIDVELADRLFERGRRPKMTSVARRDGTSPASSTDGAIDPEAPAPNDYQEARTKRERSAAEREALATEKARLDLEIARGRFVDRAEMLAEFESVISTIRGRLLAIPKRVSARVPAARAFESTYEREIHEAMTELADADKAEG